MLSFLGQEATDRLDAVEEVLERLDPGMYSNAFLSGMITQSTERTDSVMKKIWTLDSRLSLLSDDVQRNRNLLCRILGSLKNIERLGERKNAGWNLGRPSLAVPEKPPAAETGAVAGQPGGAQGATVPAGQAEAVAPTAENSSGGDADGPDGPHPTGVGATKHP